MIDIVGFDEKIKFWRKIEMDNESDYFFTSVNFCHFQLQNTRPHYLEIQRGTWGFYYTAVAPDIYLHE